MPKTQYICPSEARAKDTIKLADIPVNHYKKSLKEEVKARGDDTIKTIFHDMALIREFETMLNVVKQEGVYQGVEYDNKGPAHLSVGQEAAAVGMAFTLSPEDHIFGSHRSHGEILAKGLSAIRYLDDDKLMEIMKNFDGAKILKVIEKDAKGDVKDLAKDFLVYGALAEIFGRDTGFNRGLGGSMHAFFTPFGIYPNNALVGGSADIAAGAALFKRVNQKDGLVIANIGDASMGCGPVWEALNFSAMEQYNSLWDEAHKGGLPIIFNVFNNHYGMGGQTSLETMGYGTVARIGAGVNKEGMHAERVDGFNPLAVIDAIERKRELIKERKGPVLLDTMTYRFSGHSPSDASSYREKEEVDAWKEVDPIITFAKGIVDNKVSDENFVESTKETIASLIGSAYRKAIDYDLSPRIPVGDIKELMFSNKKVKSYDTTREGDALMPYDENPHVIQLKRKSRSGIKDGKVLPKNRVYQFRDAIFESMLMKYHEDPTLIAYGEENRDWGGAFACYRGLTESMPYHRLFNSPISEAAIVGSAVGYALEGGRAVVELMYCDFLGRAGDEVFNQMAKWQSMSAGVLEMPMVLRISVGNKYGAQHSQDWVAMCAHVPGLKVVFPTSPYDAKGLLNSALSGTDPVVFFESQKLYDVGELFEKEVPEEYYEVEIGKVAKRKDGNDVTIITLGAPIYDAMDAAKDLEENYGVSAEVFDLRSVNPLDYEPLIESIKKTGKVVLASDACERGSFMQTVAANLSRYAFDYLDGPACIIGAPNWISPCAEMEDLYFPQKSWILDAIHENILPLNGYTPVSNQTNAEHMLNNKKGI